MRNCSEQGEFVAKPDTRCEKVDCSKEPVRKRFKIHYDTYIKFKKPKTIYRAKKGTFNSEIFSVYFKKYFLTVHTQINGPYYISLFGSQL